MQISKRIEQINPSAAVELDRIIAKKRLTGEEILSLNAGQPDFDTPQNIVKACNKAIAEGKTKYVSINGIFELRNEICKKLEHENQVKHRPEEIVVTTGAKQALYNVLQVLVDKGDEVIIPTPCWVSYKEMVKLAQGIPVTVSTKSDYHLDLEAIKNAVSEKTRAIIINTPCNPTGAVYTEEELRDLAKLAVENDFFIISDEVYEKLIYDGKRHFSVASISEEVKNHCVTVNSFSKSYAMTGWRIGYLAATEKIALAVCALQSHSTSNSTTFVQWAAVEALNGPQDSVENMRLEFCKRRSFIYERLNSVEGIKCTKPSGAFYMFPDVSSFFGKQDSEGNKIENVEDLCKFILDKAKVAVLPGSAFDCPSCIRIAYASSVDNISVCMDRIEQALKLLH